MEEIIKYWKKWSRDPDEQIVFIYNNKPEEVKIHSIKMVYTTDDK